MTTLISGVFPRAEQARHALNDLHAAGFSADSTTSFPAASPHREADRAPEVEQGQPVDADPAAAAAMSGALIGGAVGTTVGLATLPVLGPAAVVAGVGVGAYVGSLYGALGQLGEVEPQEQGANSQPIPSTQDLPTQVAVSAREATEQNTAIRIMREHGATGINHAEGTMLDGRWIDRSP